MPAKIEIDEEWLRQKYLVDKLSAQAIGELIGCSKGPILRRLNELGICRKREPSQATSLMYRDEQWLREQYWENELSVLEMAALCNVGVSAIQSWMKHYDIPFRDRANQLCKDADWLREKYWDKELSSAEIAELAGTEHSTVIRWMKKHGMPRRTNSEAQTLKQGYGQYKDEGWLREYYIEKGLSTYEIADIVGCGFQTVCRWLDEAGISRRDWTEHLQYNNREPSWNDKFFDELTNDGAYIIGMIISDGYLRGVCTDRYVFSIVQNETEILNRISAVLDGGNIHKNNKSYSVIFNSKHAYEILTERYALPSGRKKSYTVKIPDCILCRDEMLPHVIRGIFDGDGSVNDSGTNFTFTSGSEVLLEDISAILERLVSISGSIKWVPGGYIKKNGKRSGAWTLSYFGVLDAIDFAKFIYGPFLDVWGSSLFLERKRKRFSEQYEAWTGREWLLQQIENGRTAIDIGIEIGRPPNAVSRQLLALGVYDSPFKNSMWLETEYVQKGKSVGNIANSCGVASKDVWYYVDKYALREKRSRHWNLELGL